MHIQNNHLLTNIFDKSFQSGTTGIKSTSGMHKAAMAADMVEAAEDLSSGDTKSAVTKTGSVIGTAGGIALGSAIGSFLFPGAGTAMGGFIGGLLGDLSGKAIANTIYDHTASA
ncbi:hypothetical protein [Vibrio coralliilyticus]|uniref:Uncharacterized protein n=1 Tax=Vibrio coralliilyticus TaxID=190893 RepID=A0AAP7DEK3_9VIBR|nr:hypothetical protein [Vibrio coralliilyticus]NOJ24296.1 hypothetical protein [Vibrio coralliilyticus]